MRWREEKSAKKKRRNERRLGVPFSPCLLHAELSLNGDSRGVRSLALTMGDVAALTWPLTRPGGLLPPPSSRTRRCLFGPVDHEKTIQHVEDQRKKMLQQDKIKWNFDFETGLPLKAGRYKWEKVGAPPHAADSNGETQDPEGKQEAKEEQTLITDFMRKRKSSSERDVETQPKTRRRSST